MGCQVPHCNDNQMILNTKSTIIDCYPWNLSPDTSAEDASTKVLG